MVGWRSSARNTSRLKVTRDDWAKNDAVNKGQVKVYIGAPAQSGPGLGGYVDAQTLGNIVRETQKDFTSFGGVMLWDIYLAQGRRFSDNSASLHSPDIYR